MEKLVLKCDINQSLKLPVPAESSEFWDEPEAREVTLAALIILGHYWLLYYQEFRIGMQETRLMYSVLRQTVSSFTVRLRRVYGTH